VSREARAQSSGDLAIPLPFTQVVIEQIEKRNSKWLRRR
jgi:hypothetical protein